MLPGDVRHVHAKVVQVHVPLVARVAHVACVADVAHVLPGHGQREVHWELPWTGGAARWRKTAVVMLVLADRWQ